MHVNTRGECIWLHTQRWAKRNVYVCPSGIVCVCVCCRLGTVSAVWQWRIWVYGDSVGDRGWWGGGMLHLPLGNGRRKLVTLTTPSCNSSQALISPPSPNTHTHTHYPGAPGPRECFTVTGHKHTEIIISSLRAVLHSTEVTKGHSLTGAPPSV